MYIFDIETVLMSGAEDTALYQKLVQREKNPHVHPLLVRVVSIAVCEPEDPQGTARCITATDESDERTLLEWFLRETRMRPCCGFNSKHFDTPVLIARLAANRFPLKRQPPWMDRYPFNQNPHTDLCNWLRSCNYSLHDMCEFLGYPSPKEGGGGEEVAEMVRQGDVLRLVEYNKADAVATAMIYSTIKELRLL